MARLILAAVVATLGLSSVAMAEDDGASAAFIMPNCKEWLDKAFTPMSGVCIGIVSTAMWMGHFVTVDSLKSCAPDGTTANEGLLAVYKYIEARPDRSHENFKRLVLEALRNTWPCK